MIEPSNAERAEWPDATRDYVAALEAERDYAWGEMKNAQAYWRAETSHAEQAEAQIEALRKALEPFAAVVAHDIGESEADEDTFRNADRAYAKAPPITVGHMRALAALSTPAEESAVYPEWRPIETAPRDGTRLIGLLTSGRAVTIASHKHHAGWVQKPDGGFLPNGEFIDVWSEEEAGAVVPRKPTHWMPFPTTPKAEAE